jgi:hypothetical protein
VPVAVSAWLGRCGRFGTVIDENRFNQSVARERILGERRDECRPPLEEARLYFFETAEERAAHVGVAFGNENVELAANVPGTVDRAKRVAKPLDPVPCSGHPDERQGPTVPPAAIELAPNLIDHLRLSSRRDIRDFTGWLDLASLDQTRFTHFAWPVVYV